MHSRSRYHSTAAAPTPGPTQARPRPSRPSSSSSSIFRRSALSPMHFFRIFGARAHARTPCPRGSRRGAHLRITQDCIFVEKWPFRSLRLSSWATVGNPGRGRLGATVGILWLRWETAVGDRSCGIWRVLACMQRGVPASVTNPPTHSPGRTRQMPYRARKRLTQHVQRQPGTRAHSARPTAADMSASASAPLLCRLLRLLSPAV